MIVDFNRNFGNVTREEVSAEHIWKKIEVPATCSSKAGYYYICERDPDGSKDHAKDVDEKFDPKLKGVAAKPASGYAETAKVFKDTTKTIKFVETGTEFDPTYHALDTAWDAKKGDWKADAVFKYKEGAEPTCMDTGIEVHECSACKKQIERVAEKVDHKMSTEQTVVLKPTCTQNGYRGLACVYGCGTVVDGVEIPATGHSFTTDKNQKWALVQQLIDESDGSVKNNILRAYCTNDGCDAYIDIVVAANVTSKTGPEGACLDGNHKQLVKIPGTPATKTSSGLSDGEYCATCGTVTKPQKYVAPLTSGLVKDEDDNWIYVVDGEQDKTYVGLTSLDNELFFIRNGGVDTSVNGIQQPEKDGTWYFFANGQVQKNHAGFALYDGAWFYINDAGILDEDADGYYTYDGAKFLVTGGWVRTDYTGMYPDNSAQTSFKYVNGGKFMEDFTGTVTIDGVTWNVTKGVATK